MKKLVIASIVATLLFILAIGALMMSIVPDPTPENTRVVTEHVLAVKSNSTFDIQFRLKDNDSAFYYINRGEEIGLNADSLNAFLAGKDVEFTYIKHRSIFDWNGKVRHLIGVSCGDSTIFVE